MGPYTLGGAGGEGGLGASINGSAGWTISFLLLSVFSTLSLI